MVGTLLFPLEMNGHLFKIKKMEVLSGSETRMDLDLQIIGLKRQIDHRLATHFHPAALLAQIAEVGQMEGRSQAKFLLKCVAVSEGRER